MKKRDRKSRSQETHGQLELFSKDAPSKEVTETRQHLREAPSGQGIEAPVPSPQRPISPDDLSGARVFVLDSHSLIYQVFHAIASMTGPDGRAVNALYGFTRDLLDIMEKWKPDLLFAAFDKSEITFRNSIYPEYKAQRESMPDDLRSQIGDIRQLLEALAVPILEKSGFEADDILATLARHVEDRGGECILVTSDKDCRQLITDKVSLLNLRKGKLYGSTDLRNDWGIRPDQVVDFQSLVGDSVDNVPGIPTIGPKTATQLLEQFGTLENVLDNWENIKGKKGERIRDGRDLALLSQQLVRLDSSVPMEFDWKGAQLGGMDVAAAVRLCEEKGFRSMTDRVAKLAPPVAGPTWKSDYQTIDQLKQLKQRVAEAIQAGVISFDTETTSTLPRWAELVGVSLCWKAEQAFYIPVRGPTGATLLNETDVVAQLRPLLENENMVIVGQNLKYDMVVMQSLGLALRGKLFDTMVADYLINPGHASHSMDDMAMRYLRHKTVKITELIGTGKNQRLMSDVDIPTITQYAAEDADVPLRLKPLLESQLQSAGLTDLFQNVEMPLVRVLADMEFHGIRVDEQELKRLSEELGERLRQLTDEIHELAGETFNVDSPKQLGEVLFTKLKLPVVKRTKSSVSTDNEVLESLADKHPLARAMIEYRQLSKLKNTYTDALVQQINPRTGRVHTSFMQDVARTGRLSSKDPNLQNIPIRSEAGRRIRRAFVAGSERQLLISADYSQIELRILAHFSKDEALIEAFENDEDIHSVVAAQVNQVSLDKVTKDMRRQAKAINFGIIYGQSPFGLAKELGISKGEAAEFIAAYFERYGSVRKFMDQVLHEAATHKSVRTILGRKREVEGVRPPGDTDSWNRTLPERIAINTVIQGSAADLIKIAMLRVHRQLAHAGLPARLLLQIHDELVLEADRDSITATVDLVRREMEAAVPLDVPLKVSVQVGENWEQTEEITP